MTEPEWKPGDPIYAPATTPHFTDPSDVFECVPSAEEIRERVAGYFARLEASPACACGNHDEEAAAVPDLAAHLEAS